MHDESAQEGFLQETKAQAISEEETPSLPELTSGQILVMVEAEQRVDDAVNILNRHHATPREFVCRLRDAQPLNTF